LVELRQRFPERRKLFLTSYKLPIEGLDPGDLLNSSYKVWGGLTMESGSFTDASMERACDQHMLLCYESVLDTERMEPLLKKFQTSFERVELLNTREVRCYECVAPPRGSQDRATNPADHTAGRP